MSQRQSLDDTLSAGEFDCALCLKLLYEPVTASCGHSYCKRCAFELVQSSYAASDRSAVVAASAPPSIKCPICRKILDRRWAPTPSIALGRLLRLSYPSEYKAREDEDLALDQLPCLPHSPITWNGQKLLPLFVLDSILPGQKMLLHVFEIRYRLLIQRALAEHNRRFGMVGYVRSSHRALENESSHSSDISGGIADVGTEVEIVSCNELPDGRFRVVIKGRGMFRVVERRLIDGYWEGSVEKADIDGIHTPQRDVEGSSSAADRDSNAGDEEEKEEESEYSMQHHDIDSIIKLGREVIKSYQEWEELVRINAWERHPRHMQEVRNVLGAMPLPEQQPGQLAIWIAAAINPLPPLGVSKEIRPAILSAANNMERLTIVSDALKESIAVVRKKRGTVEIFGMDVDVQVLLFGVFGLIVGALVHNYCKRIFFEESLDNALLGIPLQTNNDGDTDL